MRLIGGCVSGTPDIHITTRTADFYMECKMGPRSRAGQFVLNSDTNPYNNEVSDVVMENVAKGVFSDIDIDQELAAEWVKHHYLSKKAKFFITGENQENKIIFSTESLLRHWEIKANYREKPSGTSKATKKQILECVNLLQDQGFMQAQVVAGKIFLPDLEDEINSAGRYILNPVGFSDMYQVRVPSGTVTPTITFTVRLNNAIQNLEELAKFESALID